MKKRDFEEEPANTQDVRDSVKKVKDYFRKQEALRVDTLIPGDNTDVTVLARRTRLEYAQQLYNRNVISVEEAWEALDANLSGDDPSTYYDDSLLLKVKESDRDKVKPESKHKKSEE